jgi:uncharacterized Tic20 family protein
MKSMVSVDAKSRMDDARLWAVALCVSVVLNLLLLAGLVGALVLWWRASLEARDRANAAAAAA